MIKNISEMNTVFGKNNTDSWIKKVDLKNDFKPDVSSTDKTKTFGEFLMDSVSEVNKLQTDANTAIEKLVTGQTKNLPETMLAVEQAEIAFKTMNQIRQKVIDAYREIMRMQI